MIWQVTRLVAQLLIPMALVVPYPASAVSHPYEFHADARMQHGSFGPVDKAYGYMYVVTDSDGKGTINVMFSNGGELDDVRFNARVKFLNATGSVIREEYFESRIDAGGLQDPVESREIKPLPVSDFDAIQVDFFLTEVPLNTNSEIVNNGIPTERSARQLNFQE